MAAIGKHYSFTMVELDALTDTDARFWFGAAGMLMQRIKEDRADG